MLETCYDMVHSKVTKLLNRLDYIAIRAVMKGWSEWKYLRRWTDPCYSKHSITAPLQDTFTCARALLPYYFGNKLSPTPPPQISSNNYFYQPKVKNAIEHWNEINYLCFSATSEQKIFKKNLFVEY